MVQVTQDKDKELGAQLEELPDQFAVALQIRTQNSMASLPRGSSRNGHPPPRFHPLLRRPASTADPAALRATQAGEPFQP
jgi:hypothetical protein